MSSSILTILAIAIDIATSATTTAASATIDVAAVANPGGAWVLKISISYLIEAKSDVNMSRDILDFSLCFIS